MRPHVHDESESASGGDHLHRWDARRMRTHLRNVHDIQMPMSWDIGQLHQRHLVDHQAGAPCPTMNIPVPENPECGAYYGVGDGTAAYCRRPKNHPEISVDGIGHSPQPIPIQPKAEEAPMTQTRPDSETHADRRILVDRLTAAMAGLDFDRDWAADDGIGPNARGALRATFQRAAEQALTWLERGGLVAIPGYMDLLNQEVREQRDTAVRNYERAVREAQTARQEQATQQRALEEMAQAQAESEALSADLEEINNQLRAQIAHDQRAHGASLDAIQRKLEESEQRRQGLFTEMGEIRNQLGAAVAEQERLRQQFQSVVRERDLVRHARAEVEGERDLLRQDKARLKADLAQAVTGNARNIGSIDALEEQLAEVTDERDRAQQALMAKLAEAGTLREERDSAKAAFDRMNAQRIRTEVEHLNRIQELDTQLSLLSEDLEAITEERDTAREAGQAAARVAESLRQQLDMTQTASTNLQSQVRQLREIQDRLRTFITNIRREDWREQVIEHGPHWLDLRPEKIALSLEEAVLGERVSTVPEAGDGDVPVTPPVADDSLLWARRFAEGGEI